MERIIQTNARGAITYWFEEVWKKDPKWKSLREKGVKPKLVCFMRYCLTLCYRSYQKLLRTSNLLGFDIGPDQDVALSALDTKSQVLRAKDFGANLGWHGNTTMSVSATLKDAYA